jgi:hypothetical protein
MPRGLSSPIQSELSQTELLLPIYCVRITRDVGDVLRWAERALSFDDGTGTQSYSARLVSLSGLEFGVDEVGAIQITVANADGAITTLDRTKSFSQARCDVLVYLPGISTYYVVWSGWCDEASEINAEHATIPANPLFALPNVMVPKRQVGMPCSNVFGNTANWLNSIDFDGSECPYQRTSTIGFTATLQTTLDATTDPITFTIRWGATAIAGGALVKKSHVLKIGSEKFLITNSPAAPNGSGDQSVTCSRAYRATTRATHAISDTVLFANCFKSDADCTRHGMFGNNPNDTYASGAKKRNYFAGFPFVTGYQTAKVTNPHLGPPTVHRLPFSGNESAYGRLLPLVYGHVRISDPILLVAKPEGDFLSTLWLVAEGVLATNSTDHDQTTPVHAYVNYADGIFVNGIGRHDSRPGYGIEAYNGTQDAPEPGTPFFPAGAGQVDDFIISNLGFWGTARVVLRINTKSNPSVDLKSQSISGAMEIAYGRLVKVYTDPVTILLKATTNPAWVLFDVATSKRSGAGLDASRINVQSFIDLADYCDTTVTSTDDGSSVPRWSFNGILDQRKSFSEWMHLICLGAYALPPFLDKDGNLKVKALKSETLSGLPIFSSKVASATTRNIVWDGDSSSLTKNRRLITDIPNEIRVNFIDKSDYARVMAVIPDEDSQTDFGIKAGDQSRRVVSKTIDLPGTSTLDEAARIGTLILRAGEFGQGGLSNNLSVTFKAFYRDAEDLEIGDIIEVEDDLLDASLGERYFRVTHMSLQSMGVDGGGFVFVREIEAVLHSNAIYDDTAFTVSRFDRIDPAGASDGEPPAVTSLAVAEAGVWDTNNNPTTRLTFTYTDPSPKDNFLSVAIFVSNDDGSGNPTGDWRYITDLFASGESFEFEITNTRKHFAAVSRALSGHHGDIDSLDDTGAYKYPRVSVIVDGITDTMPAPATLEIFAAGLSVSVRWAAYTGDDLKLFKTFRVYRNTVNNFGTATKISELDGTVFVDTLANSATAYFYWVAGVSRFNVEGTAAGPVTVTAPDGSGSDTGVPDAPLVAEVRALGSFLVNEWGMLIGMQAFGGAANWNTITHYQFQVTMDPAFVSFPVETSLDIERKGSPPQTIDFYTNFPGTYYIRGRVKNSFGYSAWSSTLTRTTDSLDSLTNDTDLVAGVTPTLAVRGVSTNLHLAGNEFEMAFSIPATNTSSYFGYQGIIHNSSTLPTATTQETGTAGAINAGLANLVDLTKSWTIDQWAGKDLVVFAPERSGSPSYDYEGQIVLAQIISNTANTIVFNATSQNLHRTLTGCKYYVVNHGAGHHFHEKLFASSTVFINEGIFAATFNRLNNSRKIRFSGVTGAIWVWVILFNNLGAGRVTASPPTATFSGVTTGEIQALAIDTGRLANDAVTTAKIANLAVTNAKIDTIDASKIITGTLAASVEITLTSHDTTPAKLKWSSNGAMYSDVSNSVLYLEPLTDAGSYLYLGADNHSKGWHEIRAYTNHATSSTIKLAAHNTASATSTFVRINSNNPAGSQVEVSIDDGGQYSFAGAAFYGPGQNLGDSSLKWQHAWFSGDLHIHGLSYSWPTSHATSGYVLTNNGSGTLTWAAGGGGGGISGSGTASYITAFAGSSSVADSSLYNDGSSNIINGGTSTDTGVTTSFITTGAAHGFVCAVSSSNTAYGSFTVAPGAGYVSVHSGKSGSGTALDLAFHVNGAEAARFTTGGGCKLKIGGTLYTLSVVGGVVNAT